jgi:glycosyltransferase involved in cell wall biosynthesis
VRVVVLAQDLAGGGSTRAYLVGAAIARAGHDVEVLGPLRTGGAPYPTPPAGLRVTSLARRSAPAIALAVLPRVRADVVVAAKPRFTSFGLALAHRARSGTPVVLDLDDRETSLFTAPRPPSAGESSVARLARRVRHETALNHRRYLAWLERAVPCADARTVTTRTLATRFGGTLAPNAVDTARFDPARCAREDVRRRLGLGDAWLIVFAGTAHAHKGVADVLAAVERIADPRVRVVLVGGRRTAEAELAALRARFGRWIVRLPAQPADAIPELLAAADAVAVAQRDTETARHQFPMKLVEAMAMARPIVVSRVGDLPEIVGDAAELVAPSDVDGLAATLRRLMDDPRRAAALGARARERCVARYDLDRLAAIFDDVLHALHRPAGPNIVAR